MSLRKKYNQQDFIHGCSFSTLHHQLASSRHFLVGEPRAASVLLVSIQPIGSKTVAKILTTETCMCFELRVLFD